MILHCPLCHGSYTIEALVQDQAGRELLALLATRGGPALLSYLGLFRAKSRALAFDRALKLAQEVLSLDPDAARLEAAICETVESMRQKRAEGTIKPLTSHNYLKRVLESLPQGGADLVASPASQTSLTSPTGPTRPTSKTASAIGALEQYRRG